ncbi:MAG: extracellular solute-binding protein [Clostridiales bacterium]|nr:extracellular solute-binding protein [Clostridiales bacterium]
MNRCRRLLLCMLCAMLLIGPAAALAQQPPAGPLMADETKDNPLYIREMALLDGHLLLVSGDTLYRVDPGSGQYAKHAILGLLGQTPAPGSRFNWQLVPGDNAVHLIDTETGTLYPLSFEGEQPALGTPRALDWEEYRISVEGGHSYVNAPIAYMMAGDTVLAMHSHPAGEGYQVAAFDAKGARRLLDTPIVLGMVPGRDGKALVLTTTGKDDRSAWKEPAVSTLDPATGHMAGKRPLLSQGMPSHQAVSIAYDVSSDVLYAKIGQQLLRYDGKGPGQLCGSFAASITTDVVLCPLGTDRLAAAMYFAGIRVLDTNAARFADKPTLAVRGDPWLGGLSQAINQVDDLNVTVQTDDGMEGLIAALISGDDTFDVATIRLQSVDFQSIMRKGYASDLSGSPALKAYADGLYPSVQQAIGRDGRLYALPVEGYGAFQLYEKAFFEKTGRPLPRTVAELVRFVQDWPAQYAEDWPQMEPIYMAAYKRTLRYAALEIYQDAMRYQGGDFTYDTPLLREMLGAVDALPDGAGEGSAPMDNNEEYRMNAISLNEQARGFHTFGGDGRDSYTFYPMLLAAGDNEPAVMRLEVTALFINPRAKNPEGAMRFVEGWLSIISPEDKMLLSPGMNEPIPNPRHEQEMQARQARLDELTAQAAQAEGAERTELERLAGIVTGDIAAAQEGGRWLVSEQNIADWRALAQHNYVNQRTRDGLASEEVHSLFSRYLEGQIDLEQFIREAEAKTRLIIKESE